MVHRTIRRQGSSSTRPRVQLVVERVEPGLMDMGVDLGRADVGAVIQQVGGNGAPSASERSEEREDAP